MYTSSEFVMSSDIGRPKCKHAIVYHDATIEKRKVSNHGHIELCWTARARVEAQQIVAKFRNELSTCYTLAKKKLAPFIISFLIGMVQSSLAYAQRVSFSRGMHGVHLRVSVNYLFFLLQPYKQHIDFDFEYGI
jgi:hypothetical protein